MSDKTDPAPPAATQPATQNSSQQKATSASQPSQPHAKQPSQSPAGNASPSAQNQQVQGHRQHYQGNTPGGKPYYNKRNNSNYKGNNHSSGAHQNNKQYQNYAAYPQNMYSGYNYYAYPYAQGMVPGMNGIPAYNPQSPQPATQFPVSPSISKVKITDKDGKQVDWEEKTKSSTSTPKAAAAQLSVPSTPNTSSSTAPASAESNTPAASAASAAAAAKSAAAEEFRKKILEKAQAAKKKKDEEKARLEAEAKAKEAAATPKEEPVPEKPVEVASEKPVEKVAEPVAEIPIEKPVEASSEASIASAEPAVKNDETPVAAPAAESPAPASASVSEQVTEVEAANTTTDAEPATEITSETKSETPEAETRELNFAESTELTESKSESPVEEASEAAGPQEDTVSEPASDDHPHDDDEEHEHVSEGPVFDLSSYFERVKTAEPIDDPFSFSYPYPLTGVDARWKSGAKKYRYDPQFLLQFGDFVQYPIDDAWKEKLESLGIVSNRRSSGGPSRMNSNRMGSQSQGGRFNGSVPSRLGQFNDRQNSRSGSKRRGGSGGGNPRDRSLRNRGQSKRGREQEEPPKPAEEVKPLVPSANRWVPRSRAKTTEVKYAPDGSVLLEPEDIERKVNSALNKLTLEMFEPITEDLLKIGKQSIWEDDAKTIKQVISLTFAKACDEPYWSSVYAQFCAKMLKEVPDEVKDVNTLTKNGEPATGGDLARRILLATCQVEYEKGWVDKLPTNEDGSPLEPEMMSEEYYVMAAAKRRGLGLVKFIGNLYILNMLNDQVILHCLRDQSKNLVDPSEDSLENLAQLIKTVGPRFEATERNRAALNLVYDNIQQILDNCKLSSRIKFMLMDLQDLRRSSWKSMKQDAGPKTIKEIHNEAELKKIEEGRANAEKRRQNKGGYNNNSGFGGGDSRSNSARSGSSWGNKKDSRSNTKDSRGFTSVSRAQSNRPAAETTPSSSNLAPRETSKRTDSMASNMFAALGGDHEEEDAESHAN
ncbi:hypothetical protein OXX79_005069 [Metschnikowia pulcherrima]